MTNSNKIFISSSTEIICWSCGKKGHPKRLCLQWPRQPRGGIGAAGGKFETGRVSEGGRGRGYERGRVNERRGRGRGNRGRQDRKYTVYFK